jgi:biopolymer transport protein ExbB/TolQ
MSGLVVVTAFASKLVLVMLVFLSVWSVQIMIRKKRQYDSELAGSELSLHKGSIESHQWEKALQNATRATLISNVVTKALPCRGDLEKLDRTVRSYINERRASLEEGLPILASLGSNAPFVGLFGTVLGIIEAFAALGGTGSQSGAASVVGALAEALIATAVGLLVAIPALVAYNYFSSRLKRAIAESEIIRDLIAAEGNS